MPYGQGPLAGPSAEYKRLLSDRSRSCAGSNCTSLQLILRTCSQTSRGHTWPLSLAVPHRSVTWSPSRPDLEAMSRQPSEQVAWPTSQGQRQTSWWPLGTSRHTWTLGDEFRVLDDHASTTTTTTVSRQVAVKNHGGRIEFGQFTASDTHFRFLRLSFF